MKKNNTAFTLIEILVVIAIIGILALAATNINFNKNTEVEKRNKFINKIISIIDTEIINSIAGKGIKNSSGNIINPTDIVISLSTGSIISNYYSGSNLIGTGEIFQSPFYGDNFYSIKNFEYELKDGSTGSISSIFSIILTDGNISFSGWSDSEAVKINFPIGYKTDFKNIIFDRRTGRLNIK